MQLQSMYDLMVILEDELLQVSTDEFDSLADELRVLIDKLDKISQVENPEYPIIK
jgi:hypothetical protein